MELTDKELVIRARNGELEAFSVLIDRYSQSVRATLLVRMVNKHDADDIAQEAFMVAHRKLGSFDENGSFGAWVRTIALFEFKNFCRKRKNVLLGAAYEFEELLGVELNRYYDEHDEQLELTALKVCLTKLDQTMHTLVDRYYMKGISVKRLAEELQCKYSAVAMRLMRGRDQLKGCIRNSIEGCQL